ncbi:MAG: tryptophan--tRNA ligase [Patescibacteria group bacterium]
MEFINSKKLLSGIQPSGRLHIGNYLGALKNFVDLQNSGQYQCLFFIADLHSLTEDFDPAQKKQQVLDLLASYLAAGLDAKKSLLFIQSHVPAHSELAWILSTITPFGELGRMTQFKDKSEQQQENINVGLFTYPILMAADIILYDTKFVPVGEDQIQHLELTRTLVRRFNNKFGETFVEPQALLTKTPRVMSLQDPTRKMSKSQPEGCLFIDDAPEEIERKIMSAVTDSGLEIKYDRENKAGISNLLEIYSSLSGQEISIIEQEFNNKKYSQFKKSLAKLVKKYFAPFQRKKEKLLTKPEKLEKIALRGAKEANKIANEKIKLVKSKLGLL